MRRSSASSACAPPRMLKLDWTLSDKQLRFVDDYVTRHLAFGGARGGGKSYAVRVKSIKLAYEFPGIKIMIVRRTLDELRNNHVIPLLEMLGSAVRYVKAEKTIIFPNGSTILLAYYDSDGDDVRFQGLEVDVLFIDEATNLKQEWIQKLDAIVRGVNDFPKQTNITCNPGGIGHAYIKRLYIDRVFEPQEDPDEYAFIQALVTDNRALLKSDPNYVKSLLALPPKLRRGWLYGDWNIIEGMYFERFADRPEMYREQKWTHVIPAEDFRPQAGWKLYGAFDWGYHRPFCMNYFLVSPDDVHYLVAEYYGVKKSQGVVQPNEGLRWTREKVFAELQQFEREHPILSKYKLTYRVADPAIWDAQYGESTAEVAARYGIQFIKGDNARIPGWLQCQYRLQFDAEGYPRFYVLDSCPNFIRTIQLMVCDEHNPEDLDSDMEDHSMDCWRYFSQSRPCKPIIEEPEWSPRYGIDPLDQYKRRRR